MNPSHPKANYGIQKQIIESNSKIRYVTVTVWLTNLNVERVRTSSKILDGQPLSVSNFSFMNH